MNEKNFGNQGQSDELDELLGLSSNDAFDDIFSKGSDDNWLSRLKLSNMLNKTAVRILIVYNDNQLKAFIKKILKTAGFNSFFFAENVKDALSLIENTMTSMILCDWDLPLEKGIDLLNMVKNNPKYFDLPFIMMIDNKHSSNAAYATEEGADAYLIKPFKEQELISVIKKTSNEKLNPSELMIEINKISLFKINKNYEQALRSGIEFLKKTKVPTIFQICGECFYHRKEYEKAIQMLKEAFSIQKSSRIARMIGNTYMEMGKYNEANQFFMIAIKQNQANRRCIIDLARCTLKLGETGKAKEIINNVLKSRSSFLDILEIAKIYNEYGEMDEVGKYLSEFEPTNETITIFFNCGMKLSKNGKLEDGAKILESCKNAFPQSYFIQYNLALIYVKLNKIYSAKQMLVNTLKLNPSHKESEKLLLLLSKEV